MDGNLLHSTSAHRHRPSDQDRRSTPFAANASNGSTPHRANCFAAAGGSKVRRSDEPEHIGSLSLKRDGIKFQGAAYSYPPAQVCPVSSVMCSPAGHHKNAQTQPQHKNHHRERGGKKTRATVRPRRNTPCGERQLFKGAVKENTPSDEAVKGPSFVPTPCCVHKMCGGWVWSPRARACEH